MASGKKEVSRLLVLGVGFLLQAFRSMPSNRADRA